MPDARATRFSRNRLRRYSLLSVGLGDRLLHHRGVHQHFGQVPFLDHPFGQAGHDKVGYAFFKGDSLISSMPH